ncbi:hypothetical protein C3F34_14045 [Acinetobacter sp. ACNIH2]|uniref:hypothetical protein n=1 Tax=Acinetobacter sp. ACNIH2 TaxID=1758189 RepID=UPI000CDCA8AF|nr:hypothetical protein [Acinetobacter sp. ACNIH2]AUX87044.1 hypothetical protein C3F34_14045 [Acinetobacter sp. ACNIH2]
MDITEQQNELIETNGGKASPELAAQLLEQALNGDTANAEEGSQPATTQVTEENTPKVEGQDDTQQPNDAQAQQQQQVDESQLNAENAVILAKDGKHTIPYGKLVEARNSSQEWKQKFDEAQQQLAQLQADAQERKDNGQAATVQDNQVDIAQQAIEQGVDPAIFGDFDEKGLADGIQKLVDMRVSAMVQQQLQTALAPLQQQQQVSAEQAHFNEIFTAHPDAESIVESKEFNDWKEAQPSFLKNAYETVLNQGSATQVVELLGLYKSNTQSSQQAAQPAEDAVKAVAQKAVSQAQTPPPNSLSDLPAGSPAGVSRDERLAAMSPMQLSEEMQNWTPDQIEQFLNRRV